MREPPDLPSSLSSLMRRSLSGVTMLALAWACVPALAGAQTSRSFMTARSDGERCAALAPWVQDVERLAGDAATGSMERFVVATAPAFADSLFEPRVGSPISRWIATVGAGSTRSSADAATAEPGSRNA